ncbi:MAG: lmo0937 family membrane protein [Candidatus Riflebacteria bacterium]|nr:lmo0937 family membrane protein [Candidatus Riflebacteria bacterium]
MLDIIAAVLILGWVLGMVSSYTINGFIHLLLVIAIIVILVRVIGGRKPL